MQRQISQISSKYMRQNIQKIKGFIDFETLKINMALIINIIFITLLLSGSKTIFGDIYKV